MLELDQVFKTLYRAVDLLNEELPREQRLTKAPDSVVFGLQGKLDSLALVSFLVIAEQELQDNFGVPVSLADERAMSQERSPFRTLATMAEYIHQLLEKGGPTSQDNVSLSRAPARESAGT